MAVTVVLAVRMMVQVTVEADEQPDQDKNVLEPLVAGAVRVTVTPES